MIDTSPPFDEYVSWYYWAWINLVREVVVCHTAAAAAVQVLAAGGDRDAAAAAARGAAGDNAAVGRTRAGYGHRHCYVEWFIWARANLGLPDERCHHAAEAAVRCIAAGGSQQNASEVAMRVSWYDRSASPRQRQQIEETPVSAERSPSGPTTSPEYSSPPPLASPAVHEDDRNQLVTCRLNNRWDLTVWSRFPAVSGRPWEVERLSSMAANFRPGDVFFEVGAAQGELSALAADWVGPAGRVVLFEPNPVAWPNIRACFQSNGVADRVAAGWAGFAGRVTVDHLAPPTDGVHGQPATRIDIRNGWPSCADGPVAAAPSFFHLAAQHTQVPQITLDDFALRAGLVPDVVNIDVEGAEMEVLSGAARLLGEHRPLLWVSIHAEAACSWYGVESPVAAAVIAHVGRYGYQSRVLDFDHELHVFFYHPDGRPARLP